MRERCQLIAQPSSRLKSLSLLAIDSWPSMAQSSTRPIRPPTRWLLVASLNHYGPGAYPQVRGVLLAECGSHAVVGLSIDGYAVSEVHGAHRLLEQVGANMLVLVDAGITGGEGFSSTPVSEGLMCWGPWKPGRGNS